MMPTRCAASILPYDLVNEQYRERAPKGKGVYWNYVTNGIQVMETCNVRQCPSCYANYLICDIPCLDSDCLRCTKDLGVCTDCKYNLVEANLKYKYYGACLHPSAFPPQVGIIKALIRTAGVCGDNLCEVCTYDTSKCTLCKADSNGLRYVYLKDKCIDVPVGQGVNIALETIVPCFDTNCKNCRDNYELCTACDTTNLFYLGTDAVTAKPQCQSASSPPFPLGFGPSLSTGKVEKCQIDLCEWCPSTIASCSRCVADAYFYPDTGKCYAPGNFPTGAGIVKSAPTKTIGGCEVSSCMICFSDNTKCEECVSSYYLYLQDTNCYTESQIAQGNGKVISTTILDFDKCSQSLCLECFDDHSKCTKCSNGVWLEIASKICYAEAGIPDGYGKIINSDPLSIEKCTQSACAKCREDSTLCTECKSGGYIEKTTQHCYAEIDIPDTYGKVVGADPLEIKTCTMSDCLKCRNNKEV